MKSKQTPKYSNKRKKKKASPLTSLKQTVSETSQRNLKSPQKNESHLKNPFQDLKKTTKKKVRRSIPKIPIEDCPSQSMAIIGNKKGKDNLKTFLHQDRYSVCIVWGPTGVGKSSLCHLLFRENNIWPHTTDNLLEHVRVNGKRPKMSQSIRRMMKQRLPRKEIFFLDHVESFCINDPEEMKKIVRLLISEDFQRCGIKMVIGINNLYSKECAVFRKLLEPVRINTKEKRNVCTQARFYDLNKGHIEILLKQKGIFDRDKIKRGIDVSNGDGRQACLFARMERARKGKQGVPTKVVGTMDVVLNPFDSCRMALQGQKEKVLSGSEWTILKELLFHNYPTNLKAERSTWDPSISREVKQRMKKDQLSIEDKKIVNSVYKKDLEDLDEMALFSNMFSDGLRMNDAYSEYMTLSGCASSKKKSISVKWPDTLFFERKIQEKRAGFDKMRMFFGFQREDITTVCKLIEPKIIKGEKAIIDWCYTYEMSRSLIHDQAHVFE
jgi:hypothetical protein